MNMKLLLRILGLLAKKNINLEGFNKKSKDERAQLFQSYIVSNRLDNIYITKLIYRFSDYNELLNNNDIKDFFSNIKSKKILKILHSRFLSNAYMFLIINNISKEKLIYIFDQDNSLVKYYTGNDSDILIRYCSSFTFEYNIINRAIYENENVFNYYAKNRPELLLHLNISDNSEYIEYIIDYLKKLPEKILDYYGSNEKVVKAIMELIVDDYKNIMFIPKDNPAFTSDMFSDFICRIIEKHPDSIRYYFYNSQKVNKYIIDNNLHFEYDEIPTDEIELTLGIFKYSSEDYSYVQYLLKHDIRFINHFDRMNDNIYDFIYNMLKEDINNILILKKYHFDNIIRFSDKIVTEYLFPLMKSDLSMCNLIFPYISDFIEPYNYVKKILNENIDILLDYPELFVELERQMGNISIDRINLIRKIKSSKNANNIIGELIQIDQYYSELFNFGNDFKIGFYTSLLDKKVLDKLFLRKLKKDMSFINYYTGSNSKIYKYYFENGGEITENILRHTIIDIDTFVLIKGKLREFFINNYDIEPYVDDLLDCFEFIIKNNDEAFSNFEFRLLSNKNIHLLLDYNTNKINVSLMRCLVRSKYFSSNLYNFFSTRDINCINVFTKIIKYISESDFNYYQLAYSFIEKFNYPKGNKILRIISDINVLNDKKLLDNLIYYIINDNSSFIIDVDSIDDLKNMEKKLEDKMIHSNKDLNVDFYREYVLFTNYRLSIDKAKYLVSRYGSKLDNFDFELNREEIELLDVLKSINLILNATTIEELNGLINKNSGADSCFYYKTEERLRIMYAKRLNESLLNLSSITKKKKVNDREILFAFDEDNPKEFKILLTSLGAYSYSNVSSDYLKSWFRAKETSHAFCSSLISNQKLGTAPINNCCLGFSSIPEDSLLLAGPYDIYSNTSHNNIINQHHGRKCKFLFPTDMINSTRRVYNELVVERTTVDGKISPSCIIFFCNDFEKKKSTRKFNILWKNACKASDDLGVPIVVIEYSKIADYENSKFNELESSILSVENYKDNMISEYITRMMNNCSAFIFTKNSLNFARLVYRINKIFRLIYSMLDNGMNDYAQRYYDDLCNVFSIEDSLMINSTWEGLKKIIGPDMQLIKKKLASNEKVSAKGIK